MPPADSRVPHHMPMHSSYPPPGPGYSSQPSHPMHHHPSARQLSTGPPPMPVGGPPPPLPVNGPPSAGMPMSGPPPPPEAVAPPPAAPVSNGHSHGTPAPAGMSPAARAGKEKQDALFEQLATANENTWMLIGAVSEQMNDQNRALEAFEHALRHNPNSLLSLNAVASIWRSRDQFDKAIEYFQHILNIKQDNGEVWGSMGHCLLMKDDLPKAYTAYQQALHYLPNPKEPKLWYGIGILYDRYGSFEHAEEAFSSVLKMDRNFEKANEIYFRLGIIYKHQRKYAQSLHCFRYIIDNPPRPLTSWDIWFQLGHVYELDRDYVSAREAYMRVLSHQPDHAKVLQQLGWLYTQPGAPFANQEQGVAYLTKSLETDGSDAQSWYLLGRAFMAGQRYNKAYEAYQQAVYRDGRNPTFWCSIGVLYFQINQYRDALDAYSRAIRINPYISEVWYNLGSLYESCNNQITDAIDAYSRAADLDPTNTAIKHRLQLLQNGGNQPIPPPPAPVDVHPSQYNPPPQGYGANGSPGGSPRLGHPPPPPPVGGPPPGEDHAVAQPGRGDLPAPPPEYNRQHSPGPFRGGGAPPPLANVDESRGNMSRHAPLGPIDTDRPGPRDMREQFRDGPRGGPPPGGPPGPAFNGGPPMPTRYDPTHDGPTPPSPRRRHQEPGPPPQGYPAYPPGPPHAGFREHEEWERRGGDPRDPRDPRVSGMPPHDPRGPSPRPNDRHPADPRGPMGRSDSRDFQRPPDGFHRPPYGGPMGFPPGERPDDLRDPRDMRDPRDIRDPRELRDPRDLRMGYPENERMPPGWDRNGPPPSVMREASDMRAPSPAASTGSRASRRGGTVKKEDDKRKPSAPKGRIDPKGRGGRMNGDEASPRPSPAPSHASSGQRTTHPSRTIDEDYDEGAADALMFLHADRRAPSAPVQPPPERSPPNSVAGIKRTSPPSPELSRPMTDSKKSRGSPPTNSPTKRHTVIEVLNAGREVHHHSAPRIEVLNKPHEKSLRSPMPPRSPEISVRPASKPVSPKSPPGHHKSAVSPVALAATPAPTSDTRTSPVAVRSPIVPRSPETAQSAPHKSKSPEDGKRSPVAPMSPKAPLSTGSEKDRASATAHQEDVEMADAEVGR